MLDPAEALRLLLGSVEPLGDEMVGLDDALGRVLAERVVCDRDTPASDRSAMDGFAVRSEDVAAGGSTLTVAGEVPAGRSADGIVTGAGQAIRIFTGAPVPRGADAVVMVELTVEDRERGTVRIGERPEAGQNIRRRGEDRREGDEVLAASALVDAAAIAAMAAVGCAEVRVVRLPRAAVLSTGDELVDVASQPAPHQVRNSNAAMLRAQLSTLRVPATDLGIVRDVAGSLDEALGRGAAADVLLVSGGVSVGDYDLVVAAVQRAGYEVLFHTVAMRPGKPLLAARRGGKLVIGLPGNPLSAFTGFHVFVVPVLRRLAGHADPVVPPLRATLLDPIRVRGGRVTYQLARLDWREGRPIVAPVRSASSGDVLSLARANAFIRIPIETAHLAAGDEVDVTRWPQGC